MTIRASEIPFRKDSAALASSRTFVKVSEGSYRLDLPALGVTGFATHVRRNFGALVADVTIRTTLAGAKTMDGVLASEAMDLSRRGDRGRLAAFLAQRSGAADIDWVGVVEVLCVSVLDADRVGDDAVVLKQVAMPDPDTTWDVLGIPLLQHHPTIIFGTGGEGKSLFALNAAGLLGQRGVSVLYADWEFDKGDHKTRLRQLFGDDEPGNVIYVRCQAPLVEEVQRLAQILAEYHCRYLVCDSIVFGVSGPPEKAEAASAYYRALRSLKVGSLLVAHTTKGYGDDQAASEEKPFGSVFWTNGCRSMWFLKREHEVDDQRDYFDVALYHRKSNVGRKLSARGLRVTMRPSATMPGVVDRIIMAPIEVAQNEELAARLPTWQRIRQALSRGPQPLSVLAETLETPEGTVRKAVARQTGMFQRQGDLVMLKTTVSPEAEGF